MCAAFVAADSLPDNASEPRSIGSGLSDALSPVPGRARTMRDGHNQNEIVLDGVEDPVRENSRQTAAHSVIENTPRARSFGNAPHRIFHRFNETRPELRRSGFVVSCRGLKLSHRFGVKLELHRSSELRT
jgi:hypothetical protein